jgi:hypothetical protein
MQSRREFHAKLIGSAITFGLVEMLWSRDLFAAPVKPTIGDWFRELTDMTKDLRGRKLTDIEFQTKMEDLYKRVDLKALCQLIKLDEVEKTKKLPENGALNAGFDLTKVEGLPASVGFGKQIFGCKKGTSNRANSRPSAITRTTSTGSRPNRTRHISSTCMSSATIRRSRTIAAGFTSMSRGKSSPAGW